MRTSQMQQKSAARTGMPDGLQAQTAFDISLVARFENKSVKAVVSEILNVSEGLSERADQYRMKLS